MYLTEITIGLLYYSTVKRVLLDLTQSVLLARFLMGNSPLIFTSRESNISVPLILHPNN